jgi:hypothetical protein
MRCAGLAAIMAVVLSGCAPVERGDGRVDSGGPAGGVPLISELRAEPAEFVLANHREIKIVFSLRNESRRLLRLDFPTAQHLEVTLRGPAGRPLFLWSEDRIFAPEESVVVVNPRERLEFEASVPTRDMVAGRIYTAEAVLSGYAGTAAVVTMRPR